MCIRDSLCDPSAVWLSGRLWASLGGGTASFDPATAMWQPFAGPTPTRDRSSSASPEDPSTTCAAHELHAVGQRLVAIGERSVGVEQSTACATAFDPATGAWEPLPDPPVAGGTAVAAGDHRDLHRVDRRQRQMCIRDRSASVRS